MQSPKVQVKMDLRKLIISAHHLSPGLYTRLLHGLAARLLEMTFLVLLEYNFVAQGIISRTKFVVLEPERMLQVRFKCLEIRGDCSI